MSETAPSPRKRPTATGNGAAVAVQAARLPALAGSAPGDPIARALAAWMRSYEASPHTARAYAAEARRFAAFLARTPSLGGFLACKASAVSAYIEPVPIREIFGMSVWPYSVSVDTPGDWVLGR